jgi:SAM-dependent MidA family methyltransferase
MTVKARILRAIRERGPIPFDEFMNLALYGPGGFFAGDRLRSVKAGDFLTSPEVSPLFGAMLARFVAAERRRVGDPFRLVEVGAGSGSLLAAMPPPLRAVAWAVEVSPAARAALSSVIEPARVVAAVEDALGQGAVIANELLDNLPMAVAVRRGEGWAEHAVEESEGDLTLVEQAARPEVAGWADEFGGPVGEGGLVEVQLAAGAWIEDVLRRIGTGALVVIDYGGTVEELEGRRTTGTLRTYRSHHLGPEPLVEPGATDITADVNFSAAMAAAETAGAGVELHRQDDFLTGLGLRDELTRLREEELRLARSGDEFARLRVRSDRTDAEALLNPRGLGDFRVLVARL